MAKQHQKQSFRSFSSDDASLELYESVKKLAETGLRNKERLNYDELLFSLRRWWCQYYKRPYKDPLLDSYTIEELMFEYFDITESNKDPEAKVSEEVESEDRDWAAEEDEREAAEWAMRQDAEAQKEVMPATPENDTIVEEAVGLADDKWADKHEKVLVNPTADDVDSEDGDISAKFEG